MASRPQPAPLLAETYDLVDYDSDEEIEAAGNNSQHFENLLSAAKFIDHILTDAGIVHAFVGGFSLRLLGSPRESLDVDVVFLGSWLSIWNVLRSQRR